MAMSAASRSSNGGGGGSWYGQSVRPMAQFTTAAKSASLLAYQRVQRRLGRVGGLGDGGDRRTFVATIEEHPQRRLAEVVVELGGLLLGRMAGAPHLRHGHASSSDIQWTKRCSGYIASCGSPMRAWPRLAEADDALRAAAGQPVAQSRASGRTGRRRRSGSRR